MRAEIRAALASHASESSVGRELHAVPPHAVYEVEFDGRRAVCKVARGPTAAPAVEARVLEYVAERTSVPVPRILAVGDDHFVAEWRDDVPDGPDVDEAKVRAMGRGLAALHAEAADDFDAPGTLSVDAGRLASSRDDRWSDVLCATLADRADYLDGVGYGDVAREALSFVRDRRDLFDGVDDVTLLHGNYLPDHVGVAEPADADRPEVACVIDFEHALVGPGEWDYLRTAVPLFRSVRDRGVAEETFRDAYESVRPLPPGFERRRDAYVALLAVSYLKALHVQRTHLDAAAGGVEPADPLSTAEAARRARRLRSYARDALEELRADAE